MSGRGAGASGSAGVGAAAAATRRNRSRSRSPTRRNVRSISYINATGTMRNMLEDNPKLSKKVRELLTELRAQRNRGEVMPAGFVKFLVSLITEELKD
jgi:hypothetical protein